MVKAINKKAGNRFVKWLRNNWVGWAFICPAVLGFLIFTIWPMIASFVYSFHDYDMLMPMSNFGLQNYQRAFTTDWDKFSKAIKVTVLYTITSVPLDLVLSFIIALLLNKATRGIRVFRVLYYLPCVMPAIASGLMWRNFLDVEYGLANSILKTLGLPEATFFNSADTAMGTLLFTSIFGMGGSMILWISQLKSIPPELYEAADIDGANVFKQLFTITIPLVTPMIFYKLVLGVIGSLQAYSGAFIILEGGPGPDESLMFWGLRIYYSAFGQEIPNMGYASALAWMLFAVIGVLTIIIFKTNKWTFYGEDAQ